MTVCTPVLSDSRHDSLTLKQLQQAVSGWFIGGEIEGWSGRTLGDRRDWVRRLNAFLEARGMDFCADGLRSFVLALMKGTDGGGRKALSPASVKHAHVILNAFGNWCVREGYLTDNPVRRVAVPKQVAPDINPFTDDELVRLFAAAGRTRSKHRDMALLYFMDETGIRASELVALRVDDVRLSERQALIRCGKGGKARTITFGANTVQALFRYLREEPKEGADSLFSSSRGGPLTRFSLLQVCRRLGKAAGVEGVHPHRFRHDTAVRLLRNGGGVFSVMTLLGHSRVSTTQIYVKVADADLSKLQATASPIDNLLRSKRAKQ
ncbi:MAG: tyrosine-type recombinase/integrase [Armatimonadetes bacterium]|nr:tyrosine-type recombinase/integrase [Armatimonadota bacterium]